MSSKSIEFSSSVLPHLGIGFALKISSAFRRNSSIHSGSFFLAEIARTTSSLRPFSAL